MLNLPIYLYPNTFDVILDLDDEVRGAYNIMYQRDLKIQKGLKNNIRIQFKNSDQKRIDVSTQTFVFSMYDEINQKLLIEKQLNVLDQGTTSTRGLAKLTLTETDLLDLNKSSYGFCVKMVDSTGGYLPTYSNTYYGIKGTLQLLDDVNANFQPSQEVVSFIKSFNPAIYLYEHKSGNIYSYPEYCGPTALHTAAMYMTNFRGTVYIQATLDNTPASFGNYSTVASRTYDNFTGVDYVNFNGIYTYVRFMYVPAKGPADPDNDNITYSGTFDKVLYRS